MSMIIINTCQKVCVCITLRNSCQKIRNGSVVWTTSEPRVTLTPSPITNNCVTITGVSVGSAVITATITIPGYPVTQQKFIVTVIMCPITIFTDPANPPMPPMW